MPGVAAAPGGEAGWGAGRSCIADALAAPADRSPVMRGSRRARPAARSVHVTIACRILHRRGSPSLMSHSRVQGAARQQPESWGWVRTRKDNTEQLRDSISQLCCINAPHMGSGIATLEAAVLMPPAHVSATALTGRTLLPKPALVIKTGPSMQL